MQLRHHSLIGRWPRHNLSAKLRDHPLLKHRGVRAWPPVWVKCSSVPAEKLTGEIGILRHVYFYSQLPTRLFLLNEIDGGNYIGTLLCDNAAFCLELSKHLRQHIATSIKDIGDLDLSHTL